MNRIIDWWHRRFGTTMPRHVRVLEVFLTDPERWWFGYDLIQDTQLSSGKLYPTLARLERDAWITGAFEDIKENEEGRPARRGYRLTEAGRVHARALVAKWKGGSDTPAVRPTLAAARLRADELMGRSGPDADGYVEPFAQSAREVLAALLYVAQVAETEGDQVHQWARTYSLEPYELLAERVSGEAEDPDARTARDQLLTVYQGMPEKSRDAIMIQVVAALKPCQSR